MIILFSDLKGVSKDFQTTHGNKKFFLDILALILLDSSTSYLMKKEIRVRFLSVPFFVSYDFRVMFLNLL